MSLSNQDKLALALTSAGSQRALAKIIGVSHQKIGRWLREGVPATIDPTTGYLIHSAGIKHIPDEASDAINLAFEIHKQVTKDQARADKLPYSATVPVFIERKLLRTGAKGERVAADNTEFIKGPLRDEFMRKVQKSEKFINASVRSTVSIKRYFDKAAKAEIKATGRRITAKKLSQHMQDSFMGRIVETDEKVPLYTKYENIGPGTGRNDLALRGINQKLKEKHEPAAIAFADAYLFQLKHQPAKNEKPRKAAIKARNIVNKKRR
jgi:hypothetical protein